jgi:hypothetical protein
MLRSIGRAGEGSIEAMSHLALLVLTVAAALSSPVPAEPPLVRLADALAAEIERVAGSETVELLAPQDLTGATLAADLRELTLSRLQGRVLVGSEGPRLVVSPVISETARELVVSARVVRVPEGTLVDLITASAATERGPMTATAARARSERARLEVISAVRTPPLEGPVLDLLPLPGERLLVLFPGVLALYRWDESGLALLERTKLKTPRQPMRAPAGMIWGLAPGEPSWILEAASEEAVLYEVQGSRLKERSRAAALPWPGAPSGLRYRIGTHLLEGLPAPLGPAACLAVRTSPLGDLSVSSDGRLVLADGTTTGLRVGPALAWLWPAVVAAPSASPPGPRDVIQIIDLGDAPPRLIDSIGVEGAVRALTARSHGNHIQLLAGVDETESSHLLALEVAPIEIDMP